MPDPPGLTISWQRWHGWFPEDTINIGYSFRFQHLKDAVWFYGINYPTADSPGEVTQYLCTDNPYVETNNIAEGKTYFDGYFEMVDSREFHLWGKSGSKAFRTTCYPGLSRQPMHRKYLRFPVQEEVSKAPFMVAGSFHGYICDYKNFVHAKMRPAELHYLSASEDYDLFLRDVGHLMDIMTSSNLSDIFVRENVHSNVQGAIGILGAKVEKYLEWEGRDSWTADNYFLLASVAPYVQNPTPEYAITKDPPYPLNIAVFKPYELFHYEYWFGTPLPDWAPEWDYGFHHVEEIQSQEELEAHGLGQYGSIDFSKKKALYCAMRLEDEFPFLVSYAVWPFYPELEGKSVPTIGFCQSGIDSLDEVGAFRFVILVEKDDNVAHTIHSEAGVVHFWAGISKDDRKGLAVNTP